MIHALLLVNLLFFQTKPSDLQYDMVQRMIEFDKHYYALKADLLGCPKGAEQISECSPSTGTINYKEFMAATKEARKLFMLDKPEDPCLRQ